MKLSSVFVCLIALVAAQAAVAQEEPWLPEHVEQQVVEQLAGRLGEVGQVQTRHEDAQRTVAAVRQKLESWGEKGVLQRAPRFPELRMPQVSQQHLDAMARYYICNMILYRLYADPALRGDGGQAVRTVKGLTGLAMAVVYLRQPFHAVGGSDEQMEALMAGDEMGQVFAGLQENAQQLEHAASQCVPLLQALAE